MKPACFAQLDPRNLVAPTHGADPPARSATPNWLALRLPVESEIFKGRHADLRCQSFVADQEHSDASFTAILSDARPGNERLAQYSGAAGPTAAATGETPEPKGFAFAVRWRSAWPDRTQTKRCMFYQGWPCARLFCGLAGC